ncbi:MAG: tRNA (adenosine(37)-N6)-threonylcarbamoyltransferase complex ATPase subunit type 1 TsaE [Planctomycetes bacterium]|nr:tRNA (adenosine(37)-N6)-threonylcarbamoyltransferase complex ATPase subunit type 1 TsaE [Planctomycetota bacterium]MBM4078316.1 tRNA (adenosine(37)-N6)-threonylcarbamoyltransferase complex ATPase subunit type 1 TsaE [Planctomycetota bacterium]
MTNATIRLTSTSEAATIELGRRLGALLRPGDVVALIGPLGAGKTRLVKGIALGLGVTDERRVTSPTFVLLNRYAGRVPLYHFDAYRLRDARDMVEIGCEEIFAGDGVAVVEWADRVPQCLPETRIEVRMGHAAENERTLEVKALGRGAAERLESLRPSRALPRA